MIEPVSAAAAVGPLIKKVAEKVGGKIAKELTSLSADLQHALSNAFEEYISRAYERHAYFSSLVFPNQQKLLKDFYLPLTLLVPGKDGETPVTVNDWPGKLIVAKKDLLIVDTAGMGKSTVLKFLFLRAVELNVGIPIFLELRKLSPNKGILDFIFEQLSGLTGAINKDLVLRLLESGDFVFFLDGYDEIADEDRVPVTNALRAFKQHANKNLFIVSSRDQIGLNALSEFFRVTIRPLAKEEAEALIKRYSEGRQIGQLLLQKINLPENKPIQEFLGNPLLVSLLFKAFEYKPTVPLKKHVFYRQVFEALFENHDLSKDSGELNRAKHCGLDIHSFDLTLRALGFLSLQKSKIEYTKDELLLLIERAKALLPTIKFSPQDLVHDLVYRVPLLVLDGITYRWNHKSIQEYFAALYLSAAGSGTQERVLQSIIDRGRSSAYLNFLLLFIDMDEKAFRHVMIPLLVRILRSEFSHGTQLAGIESKARALRKSLTAFRAQVLVNFELEEFKKIQEKAPVSRHFFTEARRLVVAAGRLPEAWSAEIGPGPRTVVSIHHERFLLLVALSNHLNLEFLKILDPVPKPHAPLKLFWKNFHLLTDDPSDPANSPQEYAVVNEFLIRHVKLVHFDEERAGTLLATILAEIEEEKTIETSF